MFERHTWIFVEKKPEYFAWFKSTGSPKADTKVAKGVLFESGYCREDQHYIFHVDWGIHSKLLELPQKDRLSFLENDALLNHPFKR